MYKEERYIKTLPDGSSESRVKIEKSESGVIEFCVAIATITIVLIALVIVYGSSSRGLDGTTVQPQTNMRTDSWQNN